MSVRVFLALLFLAGVALSGCLGGDDDVDGGDGSDEDDGPGFDEGSGKVTGEVANFDTQAAITGATVTLIDLDQNVEIASNRTDEEGKYVMNYVEPGKYRLHVSTVCCEPDFKIITVEAESVVEEGFLLIPYPDFNSGPYSVTDEFIGFINCGVMMSANTMVPCTNSAVTDEDEQQKLRDHASINPGLKTVTIAVTWDTPGLAGSDEMELKVEDATDGTVIDTVVGTDPIEWQRNVDDFENSDESWEALHGEDGWTLSFVVRPSEVPSVVYQQKFSVYYDLHYWDPAPEGHSALPDG